MPITFVSCDKTPELVENTSRRISSKSLSATIAKEGPELTYAQSPFLNKPAPPRTILAISENKNKKVIVSGNSSFINTVINAYCHHNNLVISPDDVWLAIMTQFSFYVNKYPEELRNYFVAFAGKKELCVREVATLFTANYNTLAARFAELIDKNLTDPSVKPWIIPNFSTTTNDSRIASCITMMATFQKYFDYKIQLMCGIPNITINGTLADWKNILERVRALTKYEIPNQKFMREWSARLIAICQEFINVFNGQINKNFWTTMVDYREGGSGPSYISGWLTSFNVFSADGKWLGDQKINGVTTITSDDIVNGYVSVPLKIDDNGTEYDAKMLSGHFYTEKIDDYTIAPSIDWMVILMQ